MLQELIIATTNPHKQEEFARLLAEFPIRLRSLAEFPHVVAVPEHQPTCAGNAACKASGYARQLQGWVLADDTGLEVDALEGAPGVHSARYAGPAADAPANLRKLLRDMDGVLSPERTARFVCHIAVANPAGEIVARAEGFCSGHLLHEPVGTNGCGYDSLFVPSGQSETLAQCDWEKTLKISHRSQAVRQLLSQHAAFFAEE